MESLINVSMEILSDKKKENIEDKEYLLVTK